MLACICYYGHCQNTARLGGGGSGSGVLLNYLLGALVEVPAWCVPWLIHRLGRRLPLAASFLTSAAAGFVYAVVPAGKGEGGRGSEGGKEKGYTHSSSFLFFSVLLVFAFIGPMLSG